MKKILLFIICLWQLNSIDAQTSVYHPFPTDSAMWSNRVGTVNPPYDFNIYWYPPIHYCMSGADTIIGSIAYSKIDSCGGDYHGALRDNAGKVYYIPADSLNELLIYDFTVHEGDPVSVYNLIAWQGPFQEYTYTTGQIDSVLINGSYRKRIFVESTYWIEGIGNVNGLFAESWPNVSNYVIELACMSTHDTTLYPSYSLGACSLFLGINEQVNKGELTIFPNPSNGKFQLILNNIEESTLEVRNVLGNVILKSEIKNHTTEMDLSAYRSGIYFVRIYDPEGNFIVKKIVKE